MIPFHSIPSLPEPLAQWTAPLVIAAYVVVQAAALLLAIHRAVTLWRWSRARAPRARRDPPPAPLSWPIVTVQLPVHDERRVVERLIDAAARLRYPDGRLEIQVLDDSTDETLWLARRAARRHRARGIAIEILHRGRRDGFKAGALAAGLARARGEILVVFDADFVPEPDFLERIVPWFSDPEVGMVQARWGHLNRERSRLTAAQAVLLDAHFLVEHAARAGTGLFFNFNGTAGAWRRACIESAGGWQHDTLTEDLDLSYRAQLAGWRFVFDPAIVARAELPRSFDAYRTQQRRWVRGSMQTARKLAPALLRSPLPWRVRIEAVLHLTSNLGYPVALALVALGPAVLWATPEPRGAFAAGVVALVLGSLLPVVLVLVLAQRLVGRSRRRMALDSISALALAAGSAAHHAGAALAGLGSAVGAWERTPKTGEGLPGARRRGYGTQATGVRPLETALALYFTAAAVLLAAHGRWLSVPFLVLFAAGSVWVARGDRRPARERRPACTRAAPREREAAPEEAKPTTARSWASAGP